MRSLLLPPEFLRLSRRHTQLPHACFPPIWSVSHELKNFALSFTKTPFYAIFFITFKRGGGFRDPKFPMTRIAERYARGAYSVFLRVWFAGGSCLLFLSPRLDPAGLRIHNPLFALIPGAVFSCSRTVHARCSSSFQSAPRTRRGACERVLQRGMKKHTHQGDDLKK